MITRISLLLLLLLTAFTRTAPAVTPEEVTSANNDFESGRFIDAIASYQAMLDSTQLAKVSSPELWYNLGLAEEKSGDLPAATLSFRRALVLNPTLTPARNALAAALGTLGVPAVASSGGWREQIPARLHPKFMIVGGSIVGWLGLFLLVFAVMGKTRRTPLIGLALAIAVLGYGFAIEGGMIDPRRLAADEAVVTARNAPALHVTPADSAATSGTLAPGSLITILSRNGMWWYVTDGFGQTGWIFSTTVTPLLPNSAGS